MKARKLNFLVVALGAVLLLGGCGGGGGGTGGGGVNTLLLQDIDVLTQSQGPFSPFGTSRGGDTAVLTGSGFTSGLTVRFGATPAAVQTVNPTQVTVTTPAGPEGFATVTVTNPGGGAATLTDVFQYLDPPTIVELKVLDGPTGPEDSNRAPIAGGATVEVRGFNFKTNAGVMVDGVTVAAVVDNSDPGGNHTITFSAPTASNDSVVDVVVENPEGLTSTLARGLVYTQEFSLETMSSLLTETRARHLLRRAGFGATPDRVAAAVAAGLTSTVNGLLDFSNDAGVEAEAVTFYGASAPPKPDINNRTNKEWWIHLLVKNPNPLQERLAWFLHDHFATSERNFNADARWFLHAQINLFRRFSVATTDALSDGSPGLGYDWKRLLSEVGKDRAMLDWLDGRVSRVGNPNENYARELWELFMLGEGNNYTEADIQNAAKAFTGFFWYFSGGRGTNSPLEMRYRPSRHDSGDKTIFGVTGRFGYDDVSPFYETATGGTDPANGTTDPTITTDPNDTDGGIVALTLRERPVEASTFICRKLAAFFLYDDPHDVVVDELAADLRAPGPNQWNLRPILLKILRSKAMYSAKAMKGKVKNPVEFAVGFLRTTDIDLSTNPATNAAAIRSRLGFMGQVVLDPPDVNGWPEGSAWMGAQSMLERFNFLNFAIQQLNDVPTQIDPLVPPVGQRSPAQLVDHIAAVLDVKLSGNSRTRYIDYVTSQMQGDQVVPFAFDPNNDDHLRMKTRGLIWEIAQYHDAHQK